MLNLSHLSRFLSNHYEIDTIQLTSLIYILSILLSFGSFLFVLYGYISHLNIYVPWFVDIDFGVRGISGRTSNDLPPPEGQLKTQQAKRAEFSPYIAGKGRGMPSR